MDDTKLLHIARQWDNQANAWESQAKRTNRSKCFDGERQLRVGMAAIARLHAEQLRGEVGDAAVLLPEAPAVETVAAYGDQVVEVRQTDGE